MTIVELMSKFSRSEKKTYGKNTQVENTYVKNTGWSKNSTIPVCYLYFK